MRCICKNLVLFLGKENGFHLTAKKKTKNAENCATENMAFLEGEGGSMKK